MPTQDIVVFACVLALISLAVGFLKRTFSRNVKPPAGYAKLCSASGYALMRIKKVFGELGIRYSLILVRPPAQGPWYVQDHSGVFDVYVHPDDFDRAKAAIITP